MGVVVVVLVVADATDVVGGGGVRSCIGGCSCRWSKIITSGRKARQQTDNTIQEGLVKDVGSAEW